MHSTDRDGQGSDGRDYRGLFEEMLAESRRQSRMLAEIKVESELTNCFLDKIGRILCLTANETHAQTLHLKRIRDAVEASLELDRAVHPEQAMQLDRLAKLRAEIQECCPQVETIEPICRYVPCEPPGGRIREGWSAKSRATVDPVRVGERPHEPWEILYRSHHEDDDALPTVPPGAFFGKITPAKPTPAPQRLMSGQSGMGAQGPVTFRTFTKTELSAGWPPDSSGAKAGDVVLMSGNLWLKLSVDGGKTFTDLDFTKIFAEEKTYGKWAGDQVILYVPSVDLFVLYVQSFAGTGANANKNVVKVAVASPDDLKKFSGGRDAWRRQWDFTSDTFSLGSRWMDFPDLSSGGGFLYVSTNTFMGESFQGRLFFELPLDDMKKGSSLSFLYALITDAIVYGSPAQNSGDTSYWAAHVDNSTMRIFSSKGADPNYSWRDRKVNNWPLKADNDIVSNAPDGPDWLSTDHRIIGATKVKDVLWFAWTADKGDGGAGGFSFPHAHVQVAKFDVAQDYKLVEQMQVWNPDHAYSYPSLTTNSDDEVGISLAWGGGQFYGSHAVGILGDFVVWYGQASTNTSERQRTDDSGNPVNNADGTPAMYSRFGDYLHVRLAHPDTRFFSGFGYAVREDAKATPPEAFDFLYVEFGREQAGPPIVK